MEALREKCSEVNPNKVKHLLGTLTRNFFASVCSPLKQKTRKNVISEKTNELRSVCIKIDSKIACIELFENGPINIDFNY